MAGKKSKAVDDALDEQIAESFPASDPPSYSGGPHRVGAPQKRKSEPIQADEIRQVEKQIKKTKSKKPKTR